MIFARHPGTTGARTQRLLAHRRVLAVACSCFYKYGTNSERCPSSWLQGSGTADAAGPDGVERLSAFFSAGGAGEA